MCSSGSLSRCTRGACPRATSRNCFRDATGELLISKSAVSEITDRLWEDYQAFCSRDLSSIEVEYLFLDAVYESLRRYGARDPSGRAMESAMELAASHTQLIPAFVGALESAPTTSIPPALPPKLALLFKDHMASLDPVFDRWESAGAKGLAAAVRSARGRSA